MEGGLFIPANGQADPANITQALAKAARQRGVRIFENTKVTGIRQKDGRVTGVDTAQGAISADYVVNCAGLWAREVGRMAGVNVPLLAAEHFYVVTDASPDIPRNLPVLRVPDESAYVKEEAGKLLIGFFEPRGKALPDSKIPEDSEFLNLPDDWEHLSRELELAVRASADPEAHRHAHLLQRPGELHARRPLDRWARRRRLRNFFVAAGFNSIGIQTAGGAGKAIAEWMEAGEPTHGPHQRRHPPLPAVPRQRDVSRRPYRRSARAALCRPVPLPQSDHARAACAPRRCTIDSRSEAPASREAAGWERAGWFLPEAARARGEKAEYRYSWGRQNWFDYAGEEHKAVRTGVGLFDLSPFGKIRVEGRDAEAVLQRISANDVAVPPGRIVYTQWLNGRGGIEADLTVARLSSDAFVVVTSSATVLRDLAWLKRHTPEGAHCVATDVTSAEACLAVMGPRSRELLAGLVDVPLSNEAFPYGSWRQIEIGYAVARAHRISYVGELGWELYVPADMARHVFDTLIARGGEVDLRLCGGHALDSCRMEKGYRHFGHDIASTDHVLEAGLGFAVKPDKARGRFGDFLGRDSVCQDETGGPDAPARAIPARRCAASAVRQRGDLARRACCGLPDIGRLRASPGRRGRPRLRRLRGGRDGARRARVRLRHRGGRREDRSPRQPRAAVRPQRRAAAGLTLREQSRKCFGRHV